MPHWIPRIHDFHCPWSGVRLAITVDNKHEYQPPTEEEEHRQEFLSAVSGRAQATEKLNGWLKDCLEISRKIIRLGLGKIFSVPLLPPALEVLLLSVSISQTQFIRWSLGPGFTGPNPL